MYYDNVKYKKSSPRSTHALIIAYIALIVAIISLFIKVI